MMDDFVFAGEKLRLQKWSLQQIESQNREICRPIQPAEPEPLLSFAGRKGKTAPRLFKGNFNHRCVLIDDQQNACVFQQPAPSFSTPTRIRQWFNPTVVGTVPILGQPFSTPGQDFNPIKTFAWPSSKLISAPGIPWCWHPVAQRD